MSKDQGSAGNIDQIRSLIFGEQMQTYESRFNELQSEVADLRKEMNNSLTELKTLIESMQSSNSDSLESVQQQLQKSEENMQNLLDASQKKLSASIQELSDASVKRQDLMQIFGNAADRLQDKHPAPESNGTPE
ncbi:MAG: hypothetical protein AAFP70_03855 [Calditrichota bacterium]